MDTDRVTVLSSSLAAVSVPGYPGDSTTGIPARKEPGGHAYVKHRFFVVRCYQC